jgi:phosphoribosyl-ATP pyrophosphohydrolase/phosphoribosyl-AMP cyclohydrolase
VFAKPDGPTCHTGTISCFHNTYVPAIKTIVDLNTIIEQRSIKMPKDSYTTSLFKSGVKRISQKVGEEGVETALAATAGDNKELANESSDLIYHLLVLLRAKNLDFSEVCKVLKSRMK